MRTLGSLPQPINSQMPFLWSSAIITDFSESGLLPCVWHWHGGWAPSQPDGGDVNLEVQ